MEEKFDFIAVLTEDKKDHKRLTVAFTLGLAALTQKKTAAVLLMLDGTYVAQKGYVEDVDTGAPFNAAEELLESFLAAGGKILACEACVKNNGIADENIMEEVKMVDGSGVVRLMCEAGGTIGL